MDKLTIFIMQVTFTSLGMADLINTSVAGTGPSRLIIPMDAGAVSDDEDFMQILPANLQPLNHTNL